VRKPENPDAKERRARKRMNHENALKNRKHFRNTLKGLRNVNPSDDELYDIPQDNYERFGNR